MRRVAWRPQGGWREKLSPSRHWPRWTSSPMDGATPPAAASAWCIVCRWRGERFEGAEHCEGSACPRCGSIARDRFLVACLAARQPRASDGGKLRILETSPRLGDSYRRAMGRWFDYTCSDLDERAHKGQVRLDLQCIDLPDGSFDVVLSSHVLEHVPDPGTALEELHRIIRPGGALYLQVPLLQGQTTVPSTPEFHGDDTPVHWRFGWDLIGTIEGAGFAVTPIVPASFPAEGDEPVPASPEFDLPDLASRAPFQRLHRLGSAKSDRQSGWRPPYMFVTFEATVRP